MSESQSRKTWCGYVDVLGVRAIAARSPSELNDTLAKFHRTLQLHFKVMDDSSADMLAFSDGAFFRTADLTAFISFYRLVRNSLYDQGVFFNSAVIPGDMDIFDEETSEVGKYIHKSPPRFRSFRFAGEAPAAYQAQSALKGIGCGISVTSNEARKLKLVETFYVRPRSKSGIDIKKYFDVPFDALEISDPGEPSPAGATRKQILDQIFHACHIALSSSSNGGAYYLSGIINAIRSSNCAAIALENGIPSQMPYIMSKIFVDRQVMASIRDISGHHLIYLAAFDHLFSQHGGGMPRDLERFFVAKFASVKRCFRNLDDVPSFVISLDARKRLIEVKSELDRIRPERN